MVRSTIHRVLCIALCAIGLASASHARTETVQWSHSRSDLIASFELRWGIAPGAYLNVIDVGKPTPNSSGVYSYDLDLPDQTVFLVAVATDLAGFTSQVSNQKRIDPPGSETEPPATGDVLASIDFQGYAVGDSVPGWVDTGARNSLAQDDDLFGIADAGSNRVLSTNSTALNIHSHMTEGGDWSNYEVSGRMQVAHSSGSVGVTAYSAFPNADVYYKLFRIGDEAESDFWIVGHPEITCSDRRTGVIPSSNTWYAFRFEVTSNSTTNRIRARVWAANSSEPSTWQVTCFDSSAGRPDGGTVGVWSRGAGAKYWDDILVVSVPPLAEGENGDDGGVADELGIPGRPFLIDPN